MFSVAERYNSAEINYNFEEAHWTEGIIIFWSAVKATGISGVIAGVCNKIMMFFMATPTLYTHSRNYDSTSTVSPAHLI